jgi:phage baseplate assembly protein gpV
MSTLVGIIQQIIRQELRGLRVTELAIVERNGLHPHADESDKGNYACDVRLKNNGLVLKQVPVATGRIGTAAIPNEGDLVLLTFDHGDVHQPIIIGRLYNDEDRPPLNQAHEVIFRLPLAQPDEETVKAEIRNLSDQSPPREILVEMLPKIHVQFVDDAITAQAGKTKLTLSQPGERDGQVVVEAGRSKITMDQDGDITIESAGNIKLTTSTGDVSIEGMSIAIKGQTGVTIEAGTEAKLIGKIGTTVDGGMAATLKGMTVSIKGTTSFSPA